MSASTEGDGEPSALEAEFDTVARWTEQAVAELGSDYALAAACRGSGQPAALDWLLTAMAVEPGVALLDVGAGVGGPSAYAQRLFGVLPVLAEPMAGAGLAARRLFALPVVVADATVLPVRSASFDRAWALGVLCTTPDKELALQELRRVIRPGGRLGLLVYERVADELPFQPAGNIFVSAAETDALLAAAGFTVDASRPLSSLPAAPDSWTSQVAEVEAVIGHRHAADVRWERASHQSALMGELLGTGLVAGRVLCAR